MPSARTGARSHRARPSGAHPVGRVLRGRTRLAAAASAAVLVLTGCAGGNEIETGGEDDRFISGDGSATAFSAAERLDAPEVSGTTLDDDEIELADYAGGIVVLNVWASWCGPCRTEQPVLDEVYTEYADLGVDFLGVNIKDDDTAARTYLETQGVEYPSLYDQPGEVPQAFRGTVPPRAIPSTLVIDPDGRIAARVIGPTTYGQLTGLLDPVVVEYDLGDPQERPRVAEQEAEAQESQEPGEPGESPSPGGDDD
jgi:thiol-disulfide isomerase/thioredoxin